MSEKQEKTPVEKPQKSPAASAEKPQKPKEDPAFTERKMRIDAERERQQRGEAPSVYYCPVAGRNGHVEGQKFVTHGIPPGYEYDLEAWENAGRVGAAPLKKSEPAPPSAGG